MRINTRRPAITLLEVLAAIFIMGVGLLAILTLFPLGALNMARALRDDRLGHIAHNADALASAHDMRRYNPLQTVMGAAPTTAPPGTYLPPEAGGPSYPVFVDQYYVDNGGPAFNAFSSLPQSPVQRLNVPWAVGLPARERYFSLQDDLTFEPDGRPKVPLERQGYYTWSYMLRRSVNANPNTTEMHVIVYSGRPVLIPQQEPYYDVLGGGTPGSTSIILSGTGPSGPPQLKRGYWLFDISYRANATNTAGRVNGFFYRVIEATKLNATDVQVEVEPPLRNDAFYTMTRVVGLENAVEVFDRGTGR